MQGTNGQAAPLFWGPPIVLWLPQYLPFTPRSSFVSTPCLDTMVKRVSDLAGVTVSALTHELVKILAMPDWVVPAAAWLGVASNICEDADEGQAQKALARLLNSRSATLTSTVVDGPWAPGLYPAGDIRAIASGLVWQALGSPRGSDRWQAAHSVRCFARFGRWEVIDAVVARLHSRGLKRLSSPRTPILLSSCALVVAYRPCEDCPG